MKKAFTLIEVNLAMLIMAGGILSMVGLYAFAFRENRQSREDVTATALADLVMSPLVCALSATNITWSAFNGLDECYPGNKAWGEYLNSDGVVSEDPESKAKGTFEAVMGKLSASRFKSAFPSGATKSSSGMSCGLVVQHVKDSAIVSISFRATKLPGALLSMPMFYTEVRFQGLPE